VSAGGLSFLRGFDLQKREDLSDGRLREASRGYAMWNEGPDSARLLCNTRTFRALCVPEGESNPVTDFTKVFCRPQE